MMIAQRRWEKSSDACPVARRSSVRARVTACTKCHASIAFVHNVREDRPENSGAASCSYVRQLYRSIVMIVVDDESTLAPVATRDGSSGVRSLQGESWLSICSRKFLSNPSDEERGASSSMRSFNDHYGKLKRDGGNGSDAKRADVCYFNLMLHTRANATPTFATR